MTPQERAEKHWDGYVGPTQRELLAHMVEVCMAMSRFHYVTSHVHGVKHAEQDARETARAAFTPVQEEVLPAAVDFGLPSITLQHSEPEVWDKYKEEHAEWEAAADGSLHQVVELWDCIQALQTHRESGGHSPMTMAQCSYAMEQYAESGRPVQEAKAAMLVKNAGRGYYAPEVCKVILETNGQRWNPQG